MKICKTGVIIILTALVTMAAFLVIYNDIVSEQKPKGIFVYTKGDVRI